MEVVVTVKISRNVIALFNLFEVTDVVELWYCTTKHQ